MNYLGNLIMLNRIRTFDINHPMPAQVLSPPPIDLFEKKHFEEVNYLITQDRLFSPQFESIKCYDRQMRFLPKKICSKFNVFNSTDNVCVSTLPDGKLIDIQIRFKNVDVSKSDFYWDNYTGEIFINLKDGILDKNTINITAKIKHFETHILLTYFY